MNSTAHPKIRPVVVKLKKMTKLVAIMKATRRKFSTGFKVKVATEALWGAGITCRAVQTFVSTS